MCIIFRRIRKGKIMSGIISQIEEDTKVVIKEILDNANLKEGSLFIVGCSSSETIGEHLGTASSKEAAEAIYKVVSGELSSRGVNLAVQCCEHLNRAVVIESDVAIKYGFEEVNVIPQPHAGGAFAVEAYKKFKAPIVVENVKAMADGGMDIGGVMIGMHIHNVVVPLRLENRHIGKAFVLAARRRPKYVGGERAVYKDM